MKNTLFSLIINGQTYGDAPEYFEIEPDCCGNITPDMILEKINEEEKEKLVDCIMYSEPEIDETHLEELLEEDLDANGPVNICGHAYYPSKILKDVDPWVYGEERDAMKEWILEEEIEPEIRDNFELGEWHGMLQGATDFITPADNVEEMSIQIMPADAFGIYKKLQQACYNSEEYAAKDLPDGCKELVYQYFEKIKENDLITYLPEELEEAWTMFRNALDKDPERQNGKDWAAAIVSGMTYNLLELVDRRLQEESAQEAELLLAM